MVRVNGHPQLHQVDVGEEFHRQEIGGPVQGCRGVGRLH